MEKRLEVEISLLQGRSKVLNCPGSAGQQREDIALTLLKLRAQLNQILRNESVLFWKPPSKSCR